MTREFLINAGNLVAAIKTLKPFISKEETRYYLNGIYFELSENEDEINLVATDGHKLCVIKSEVDRLEGFDGSINAIVPKKALETILVMLKGVKADWPIALRFEENGRALFIDTPDEKGEFKLIDGTYPDYRKVIPTVNPIYSIGLAKAQAKEAMKAIASHQGKQGMQWELNGEDAPVTIRDENKTVVVMPVRIHLPGERFVAAKKDPNQADIEDGINNLDHAA